MLQAIHDATLLKATVACYKVTSCMVALTHRWIEEDTGTCQAFRFDSYCICYRATCICQVVAWEAISLNKMVQRKVPLGPKQLSMTHLWRGEGLLYSLLQKFRATPVTTLFFNKIFCKTIGSAINLEIKLTYSCTSYVFLS